MIPMAKAMGLVSAYIESRFDKSEEPPDFEVYVVWFCKTLQNWKALVSSNLPDQMYYEVTYDGEKGQTYIDAYKKFDNMVVKDSEDLYSFPTVGFRPRILIGEGKG